MRGEIEAWRRPRYDRAPLPAQLWTDALAVAQRIGVNRARLALGLSYCGLQSHVERATAAPEFVELSGAEVLVARRSLALRPLVTSVRLPSPFSDRQIREWRSARTED